MKKRSINGNHINMIKGRLGDKGIDSDAAPAARHVHLKHVNESQHKSRGEAGRQVLGARLSSLANANETKQKK